MTFIAMIHLSCPQCGIRDSLAIHCIPIIGRIIRISVPEIEEHHSHSVSIPGQSADPTVTDLLHALSSELGKKCVGTFRHP